MIIDIFTHVLPRDFTAALERGGSRFGLLKRLMEVRELHDLDRRFRTMDALGDYRQIVALPNPPIEDFAEPRHGADLARIGNDGMAELVGRHPDRFAGFIAALSMTDMDSCLQEIDRAVGKLGAVGVQIFTNVKGKALDAPEFAPLFAAMARHDRPIWLHPARSAETTDYAAEPRSRFELWWCFGWPYDTSVAMARLAFSGLFDRHPTLDIITHHLGGMIPYFDKRIENGLARARQPHQGRGLFRRAHVAEAAASRLFQDVPRRHRPFRRLARARLRHRLLRRRPCRLRQRRAVRADRRNARCDRSRRPRHRRPRRNLPRQRRAAAPAQARLSLFQAVALRRGV